MIQELRERSGSESGFTLIELLVVMLVLALLAAIAVPTFVSQRDKARDADAKSSVRTAETALETYATDNHGSYARATIARLVEIEPTLADVPGTVSVTPTADGYELSVTSDAGNVFRATRQADGTIDLTCDTDGEDGCPANGQWD